MAYAMILVVDDDPDIVDVVCRRLQSAGYATMSASNGREATQLAMSTAPDLAILDISMPGCDGHAVADYLLANENTRCMPIIFLTARTSDDDRLRAYDAGAIRYMTKPFDSEELLDTVAQALHCTRRPSAPPHVPRDEAA